MLELLIVIAIISVLSVILILVLNPAEILKKSRDTQRLSDLNTLKTALGIYLTATTTPYLAGAASNAACKTGSGGGTYASGDKIYYSVSNDSTITDTTLDNGTTYPTAGQVSSSTFPLTDGTGWLPVNLDSLSGGSPISNLPIDPVNTVTVANVTSADLVYRYACNETSKSFEIDAQLESDAFTVDDDKRRKDGGNNNNYYEAGTNLKILGTGSDF